MRKALIIGIDDYPSAPLRGCVNDALELKSVIETNEDGTPNFAVRLKTDVKTKSELLKSISELFKSDSDTEIALFYFAGHGLINEIGGYIVTPDHRQYDEGVSMDHILKLANDSTIKNRVIILDCCNSGFLGSPSITGGKECYIAGGVTILTACGENEPALEKNGRGVFTNLLLDALRGGAADLQGNITLGSIYTCVDQALGAWDQRPVFKTNVSRFTPLRKVDYKIPLSVIRNIVKYFPDPTKEYALDSSFEYTNAEKSIQTPVKPYAIPENVSIFKHLQKFQSVGLVAPVDEEHMYFAAMNSKSCKLTALGCHYWQLVTDGRI